MFTIASINLNFGRKPKTQRAEVKGLLANADVVAAQEVRFGGLWSEEVIAAPGVKVKRQGFRVATLNRLGQRIRFRRHRWKVVHVPGIGKVRVISVHMPPRRMQASGLYEGYTASLHHVIRRAKARGEMFVVVGDFNKTRKEDPARLRAEFGVSYYGALIDLFAVDPALVPHVKRVECGPVRWDGHQIIQLSLA